MTPGDFRAAVIVATTPNLIIGAPTLKANNLKEAVELAKTEKMTYGTAGAGTTPHLSAERIFKLEGKVDIPHAPFTGAGPGDAGRDRFAYSARERRDVGRGAECARPGR